MEEKILEIIPFNPEYRESFRLLNYEWLQKYYTVGQTDELILSNPEKIIREGGHIYFAKYGQEIIGTLGLVWFNTSWMEIIKMAVTGKYQGLGTGKRLMQKAIETALTENAEAIVLETAEELVPAIKLYVKSGFRRFNLPQAHYIYNRKVFAMKLDLNRSRAQKLESYRDAYNLLLNELEKFPKEMWKFRPGPGKWSIHEILIHIADSEANSYIRCRRLIAEPGSDVLGYDQDKWANLLDYHSRDTDEYIELFRLLRKLSYDLLKDLPETSWTHTIHHSERGLITFDEWLDNYEEHIPVHIEQMHRNLAAWKTMQEA